MSLTMAISVSIILIMPIPMKGSLEYANPSTLPHSAPLALGVENSAAVPPLPRRPAFLASRKARVDVEIDRKPRLSTDTPAAGGFPFAIHF